MQPKKPYVLGGVEHTAYNRRMIAAVLQGITGALDGYTPADADLVLIPLRAYGIALSLGVEIPSEMRRWAETLDAETLRGALGTAARYDDEHVASVSYAEGSNEPSWFFHVELAIYRVTLPAFIRDMQSDLGELHVEGLRVRVRRDIEAKLRG